MKEQQQNKKQNIGKNEDVEYSSELADAEDIEAQERAKAADRRAVKREDI